MFERRAQSIKPVASKVIELIAKQPARREINIHEQKCTHDPSESKKETYVNSFVQKQQ